MPTKSNQKKSSPAATKGKLAFKPVKDENGRLFFSESGSESIFEAPNLIEVQLNSYEWFFNEGIKELFEEISPISDFSGKKMELHFLSHSFDKPKFNPQEAKRKNVSFEVNLKAHVRLINKETGEIKEQDVFLGQVPLMTDNGIFLVNGIERVVVNQLMRSPGIFLSRNVQFPQFFNAKIIPKRGVWLEMETDRKGIITVKIDRKRKILLTQLLKIFGYETDKQILDLFKDINTDLKNDFILKTLEKDQTQDVKEAYQEVYKKIRPGDMATPENAKSMIDSMFFDFKRYDLGPIARYKINKKFGLKTKNDLEHRVFQVEDFVATARELVRLNVEGGEEDDIDHLANRRVRSVGELVQNKFRVGLLRMERIAKDRMTVLDLETVTPTQLINSRPITASMREFFMSSQLSQFMDQTNPLSELAHKRRLSAMGPGGLSRERASFDVRDVHPSHYGRICPISTPEGPNIGLVVHLANFARVNEYGFIETPFREVAHEVKNDGKELVGHIVDEEIANICKEGDVADEKLAKNLAQDKKRKTIKVRTFLTKKIEFFDADAEMDLVIAQANSPLDELGQFQISRVPARRHSEAILAHVRDLTHIDVSPKQIISESTALIPFLENDDNTRASMGSNMQRQAVPLVSPEAPVIGTGFEKPVARASGQMFIAEDEGKVESADAEQITVMYKNGKRKRYDLIRFMRSNQGMCFHMRPTVSKGQKVKAGDPLADGSSIDQGEIALGRNLFVAYMSWGGYNFEDAIIISSRIVQNGFYDSVHIENYTVDVRETKLGPEIVTRDIPNVGEAKLKDLDTDGIVRIGASVNEGDILVGKITPKGETELTPEERLLQAIFGEKAKDVRDTSLRLPGGAGGKVVDVQIFSRDAGDELPTGVIKQIRVYVAQTRKLQVGDKMAGRHGNKGVISVIVPEEDMPFMPDGTPIDLILNPLGVGARMNIGQVLETHLGWVGQVLGVKFATPALSGINTEMITDFMIEAGLPRDGKIQLFDGKTGEPFSRKTTVGVNYMLKLSHMVEDKVHARSVGPYSIVTQQPLGGKAQHGGQRFGEMEVWALEAYGAAHTLQEMLTIKSDDVSGRSKAYESIVKGEKIRKPSTPESFNVLIYELRALGIDVDLIEKHGEHLDHVNINAALESSSAEVLDDDLINELKSTEHESDKELSKEVEKGQINTGASMEEEMRESLQELEQGNA
jgi:DNA-directed RNA polymerase subunit beta